MHIVPNVKCQRVLVLALWLVSISVNISATAVSSQRQLFLFGRCDLPMPHCCLLQEHELNLHGGHSHVQLHTPGTRYRLTLDIVILYTPLKTSKHTCSDSLNLSHKCLCILNRTLNTAACRLDNNNNNTVLIYINTVLLLLLLGRIAVLCT